MSHYYEQMTDGTVCARHYTEMKSRPNELRPTTIADVRKWWKEGRQVVPSVTTVGDVLNKAALINWKIDQHLRVAINVDQRQDVEQWIAEVKRLTELEMDKAPSAGTDIHKALELYFRGIVAGGPDITKEDRAICSKVDAAIYRYTANDEWTSERNFVHDGFGGQVDLHNDSWVIDFKSKQTADKFKPGKMAYPDHHMQLAAYREGLGLPSARAANVFICLENGEVDFHEHTEAELSKGWELFQHALAIWQLQHGSQP